mmetsp:Transcript_29993/g.34507  ORF Transcript_29993/g.34507 Transcript_29993/m.34507 type:complete len:83 (+) Transcript_29993:581-829(+)
MLLEVPFLSLATAAVLLSSSDAFQRIADLKIRQFLGSHELYFSDGRYVPVLTQDRIAARNVKPQDQLMSLLLLLKMGGTRIV